MAHDVAALQSRIEELEQRLERKDVHIEALLDHGGKIMLGTVKPIVGAAVAHDGQQTLAMLKRRPDETVEQLLQRLDHAVYTSIDTGTRVDEINLPKSDVRYELK